MKITLLSALLLLLPSNVTSLSIPRSDLVLRDANLTSTLPSELYEAPDLEKRGSGARSSIGKSNKGSSGAKGSSGGSSGGKSGGSTGKSGGSSSSSSTSRTSNVGGTSSRGSGAARSYGSGYYYAGGARTPYAAGSRSPSGLTPFLLTVTALTFFNGHWLYGAYAYPYVHPYHYTDPSTHRNETRPIVCLCEEYSECGCDDNNNGTYLTSVLNGTVPQNNSVVRVVNVNNTETIYINGTLPNGTTAADGSSAASTFRVEQLSGYWVMVAAVTGMVYML